MYRRNQPICWSEKNVKTSRGLNKNTRKNYKYIKFKVPCTANMLSDKYTVP